MATINFYKDLPLDFTPHPVTGDVRPVTNEVAVRRSLSNLINTTKGSRPFMPDYGSSVKNYLFSRNGAFTLYELKNSLKRDIEKYEKRISLRDIKIDYSNDGFDIKLEYVIKNASGIASLQTTVKRTA
jgi:phage baseplate assembly protein W